MKIQERFRQLPVSDIADEVNISLARHPRLVVTAPPGAGKSTLLPISLLESLPEGKILMLEPRRIAARQVAGRMASMLGEKIGDTVGYRVRFDTRVSANTRIEVITEGILERMLVEDPTLEGVAAVIFDEFHERSLSSDLTLALTREIQNVIRPDLKILVMSATIDADSLCRKMDSGYIHCPGKRYDVKIIHGEDFDFKDCASAVASTVKRAIRQHEGNILAFLPGQAEILKCRELLDDTSQDAEILTLYGMLPTEKQQQVLSPNEGGKRRIVLASPIAETSLTIDGISVVVDSGLYRTPVFEPATGLSRLTTERISLDMATQRSGRAGRLMDGVCYRLWTKATESRMKESRQPEIESSDLSSIMLTVSAWGETDPTRLPWITPPPAGHLANAKDLLRMLGAIDKAGRLTKKGERLAQLPCHPRIANMLTEAGDMKAIACDIAAILEEKDPVADETDADISTRIAMLKHFRKDKIPSQWKKIDNISAQYMRLVRSQKYCENPEPEEIGKLVGFAYPERIAKREANGSYRLSQGGKLVSLHLSDDLARHEYLAIASMGTRIFLAAPVDKDFVMSQGTWMECAMWNSKEGKVIVREELRLGLLCLATRPLKGDPNPLIASVVAAVAPKEGLTMFDFNDDVQGLQLRIAVTAGWHPELELPDVSTETVLDSAGEWLPIYIGNASTVQELRKIDIRNVILSFLNYEQQQALDRIAPTHLKLPSGRNARIHYRRGAEVPIVSARLQDCFGMMKTPCLDDGKRPVLMELLSPGFKPVQLTQDMEGFWRETYFEVRKELRRRYPKHRWPEDPTEILNC
ncbi:MAG: ATP-dependent helicase HrpB [Muribaculaceae bacterium]|nr:ATP-dependent helicase HrpB [Muribaculaceae bacterium]